MFSHRPLAILLLSLLWACTAPASTLDITAEFKPSASNPNNVDFINSTPLSGFCQQFPASCLPSDVTISFPLTIQRTWQTPGPLNEQNYQRIDGTWKEVVVNSDSGAPSAALRFRINLLSRNYNVGTLEPGGATGHFMTVIANMAGRYGSTVGGCAGRVGVGHTLWYRFAWLVPESFTVCSRPAVNSTPFGPYRGSLDQISIGYHLVAPSPLKLRNGTYRGSITYQIGEGQQIDLGTGVYDDNQLTINFELTVEHQIRIDFPPGSERAVLEPPNGWAAWINQKRPPPKLSRDHPMQIWASAPLKVYLRCEYTVGDRCGIAETAGAGYQAPVTVALSLPENMRYNGAPTSRLPLPVGEGAALTFDSIAPTFGKQGQLHYSVQGPELAEMLKRAGSRYQGDVWIVFDAQL
jgi:hypothetical protein